MQGLEEKYFRQLGDFAQTESGRQVYRHMDIINIKTGSLLTHVSLMTAALGLFASRFITEPKFNLFEISILVELVCYVNISMWLLFCINITSPATFYGESFVNNGVKFEEKIVRVAARRRNIYNACLKTTIGLTLVFLLTLIAKIFGLI
ncbi:MAG: hypothetical protein SGJ17_02445 [Hyphomicrobiales bacterium]|mgnify:CR=1 FL=1|nr:hypothetical protein [Hyphomicrobiales bacterium]